MIEFVIDGPPVPQGRPRGRVMWVGKKKKPTVQVYDTAASRNYKRLVNLTALSAMNRAQMKPMQGPLRITIRCYFEIPKSYTKKRRAAILEGLELHTKKPDVDNLSKPVKDGMSKVVYHDDAQVVELLCSKHYAEKAHTVVRVEPYK